MIRRIREATGLAAGHGPYPHAVVANGLVFASGRVPAKPVADQKPQDFAEDVRQALSSLSATLQESGSSLEHVAKITTFLTDTRLDEYNEIYAGYFSENLPARTTVMVAESDFSIEIQCVAVVNDKEHPPRIRRLANAPGMAPVLGPYSQAVVANGMVFTSGQLPGRSSMQDQPEDFGGKVRQTLANLEAILVEAGSSMEHVAKVTTYLTEPGQLDEYNAIYAEVFGPHLPARTSCCVGIWDIALEIECIAVVANNAHPPSAPSALHGTAITREEAGAC